MLCPCSHLSSQQCLPDAWRRERWNLHAYRVNCLVVIPEGCRIGHTCIAPSTVPVGSNSLAHLDQPRVLHEQCIIRHNLLTCPEVLETLVVVNGLHTWLIWIPRWLKRWESMKKCYGERESRNTKNGSNRRVPSLPSKLGHGKDPVQSSGTPLLTRDLPSVANLFLLTSLSAQIQKSRVLTGERSMRLTPALTTCSRIPTFHAQ